LAEDEKYATNPARIVHRDELLAILNAELATRSKDDIIAGLEARKVPVGPVNTLPEVFATDQVKAREMMIEMAREDTAKGAVKLIGNPLKFSRTPVSYRRDLAKTRMKYCPASRPSLTKRHLALKALYPQVSPDRDHTFLLWSHMSVIEPCQTFIGRLPPVIEGGKGLRWPVC
jgi:hypothetical protein